MLFIQQTQNVTSQSLILSVPKAAHISPIICAPCRGLQSAKTSLLAALLQEDIRVWIHRLIQRTDGFTISTASNTADSAESSALLRSWVTAREMDWILLSICGHQDDCSAEMQWVSGIQHFATTFKDDHRGGSTSFRPLTAICSPFHWFLFVLVRYDNHIHLLLKLHYCHCKTVHLCVQGHCDIWQAFILWKAVRCHRNLHPRRYVFPLNTKDSFWSNENVTLTKKAN